MKDWLIRTKSNHILGPVSKEKLRELIANNSIKGDDEVCCGNGYWIYIREQDLITKYVFNNEAQPFNPVQEAEYVDINDYPLDADTGQMPSEEDLQYPDMETFSSENLEEATSGSAVIKKKKIDRDSVKASGKKRKSSAPKPIEKSKSRLYINPLLIVAVLMIILIFISMFFKNAILEGLAGKISNQLINSAHAQTFSQVKKKSGYSRPI